MADYDTGKDILTDILSRAGELDIQSAELLEEAKRYANRGYFTLVRQFPWLFAEGYPPISIVTVAPIKLVMSVNQGDTLIMTDLPVPNEQGYKVVVDQGEIPFRVVPNPSQPINSVTLPVPYPFEGGTSLSGYAYRDEYFTPDVLVATRIKNISRPHNKVTIVGYEELDQTLPISIPFGPISMASYYSEEYIRLAMIPPSPELIEIHYSKRPPRLTFSGDVATDTPILPVDERWLIADYGLYFLMVDHGDDRADNVASIAAGRVAEIKDRQIAKMSGRVYLPSAFNPSVR